MTFLNRSLIAAALSCSILPAAHAQLDSLLAPITPSGSTPMAIASASSASAPAAPQAPAANRWLDPEPAAGARLSTKMEIEGADLLAEVQKQLTGQLNLDGELLLELTRTWPAMKLPSPSWQLTIADLPAGGLSSSFYLRIKITSAGQTLAEGQLPLRAQLLQEVWVASTRLERGRPLERTQLATQKTDILRVAQPLIPASVDPESLETLQAMPAGRPLTKRDVTIRPVVRKGQVVEVVGRNGLLNVRLKALALENGAAGDLIKLRNLESRREINAQVLNDNEVQIHF